MTNKKNKSDKKSKAGGASGTAGGIDTQSDAMNVDSPTPTSLPITPASSSAKPTPSASPKPPLTSNTSGDSGVKPVHGKPSFQPTQESDVQRAARAEKVKEHGNTAFKAKKFIEAIELYTKAIELAPTEPTYLTNRAASYMALKKFRPALEDCQAAAVIQTPSSSTSTTSTPTQAQAKTLIRLARCHLALGSTTAALSTLSPLLPTPAPKPHPFPAALPLHSQILELNSHLQNFQSAKEKKEWGMARLALDKCLQAIEGEGGEIPSEWRVWRVELELVRANWDAANTAANDALRLEPNNPSILLIRGLVLFLSAKLPQAVQHAQSALRLDPGYEPAMKLRKRVKEVERLKDEGNVAFKAGRWSDAIGLYGDALECIGESPEEGKGGQIRATLLSNRATTLLKMNRHEEALVDTDASIALYPTSFKALRTRARINLHLEKYAACVDDFKMAIEQAGVEGTDADVKALRGELKKAEAALKRSKSKDYYKILGVARDCSEADIKKGYRRESLKHHPDKGGDEEKFKLVVEAHGVLSDSQRRERYDLGEDDEDGSGMGPGGMGGMSQMDLAELFSQFHGGGGGSHGGFNFGGAASGGSSHSHGFPF